MRVRCSTGLSVASCSGAFCKQSTTDLDLPAVDCNKAFLCSLQHDDKLPPDGNEAAVQVHMYASNPFGFGLGLRLGLRLALEHI